MTTPQPRSRSTPRWWRSCYEPSTPTSRFPWRWSVYPWLTDLLVDDAGRLSAVIDFGDLSAGDPATDLAAGWLVFDAAGRELFHAELANRGAIDPATWQRAKGCAIVMATALAIAAHTLGQLLD